MADRVLDQRLDRKGRNDGRAGAQRDVEVDMQPVPKAGSLETEVALDVFKLLGQGHVGAPVSKQVAGELGEVDQQLARLVWACMDVPGHGCERVIDEVGADLSAE